MIPAGARHSPCLTLQEYLFSMRVALWAICPAAWAGFRFANGIALPVSGKRTVALDSVAGGELGSVSAAAFPVKRPRRQLPGTGRRKPGVNPRRHWRLAP